MKLQIERRLIVETRQRNQGEAVVVVGVTGKGSVVVQRVLHDAKDVGLEGVLNNPVRSRLSSRQRRIPTFDQTKIKQHPNHQPISSILN